MLLNTMGRIVSLAAAGALAANVAACGGPDKTDSGATEAAAPSASASGTTTRSPSPAVSLPPPDKQSCSTGTALAQLVSVRITGAKLNLETRFSYAVDSIRDAWDQTAQAKAKVTAAQVKAIVEEYQAGLEPLKTQLEGSSVNRTKLLADLSLLALKFDKVSQQLSVICAESPDAAATAANARSATCTRIEEAGLQLLGPYMEVAMGGNDPAKLKLAVRNLQQALDAYAAELSKISGETGDRELKAAVDATARDAQMLRRAIGEFSGDQAKLQSILGSETFGTGQAMRDKVCGS
jgi:hypothetical protein